MPAARFRRCSGGAAQAATNGGLQVNAPLAGIIFKVPVQASQQVSAGDVILVLEAMKMETEVRAPQDGNVASVAVAVGDKVGSGDLLLTLN